MPYKTYANRQQMERDGYTFEGSGECNKCGQPVDWATTKHGKKAPFDKDSTVCHFDTCGKAQTAKQAAPAATSSRPGSPVAQEMLIAMRALNQNIIALDNTLKALLARMGQRRATGETMAAGNGKPEADVPTGVLTNAHGVTLSDQDVPF